MSGSGSGAGVREEKGWRERGGMGTSSEHRCERGGSGSGDEREWGRERG